MSIKTIMDGIYSVRMLDLLRKPFRNWEAYKRGIIDEAGEFIKKPETVREKAAYTSFHAAIRSLKINLQKYGGESVSKSLAVKAGYDTLTESYGQSEYTIDMLYEEMIAGDSGGNVTNIATGVKSGSVTDKGPSVMGKKKERRKIEVKAP